MPAIQPSRDIRSLSEFRSNAASLLRQVRETKRPLVLTQHGRGTAVVLDAEEYERLTEELDLLRDVKAASEEFDTGGGVPHAEAQDRVRKALGLAG